jgi:hypothetical protein
MPEGTGDIAQMASNASNKARQQPTDDLSKHSERRCERAHEAANDLTKILERIPEAATQNVGKKLESPGQNIEDAAQLATQDACQYWQYYPSKLDKDGEKWSQDAVATSKDSVPELECID